MIASAVAVADTEVQNYPQTAELAEGKYYRFKATIRATGVPTKGPKVCEPVLCTFERGRYLRPYIGSLLFHGKPINDVRNLWMPETIRKHENCAEGFRDCFFVVPLSEGIKAELDLNQEP